MLFYYRAGLWMLSIGSIPYLISFLAFFNFYYDYLSSLFEDDASHIFDFIVVGAGSAGAVIANRLSKNNRVLVLEAGGNPVWISSIPALASPIIGTHNSWIDWAYKTIPQKRSSFGVADREVHWPRGKGLGGSSVLNSMFYLRGNPLDYEQWANITEDSTWSYKNVLPYFNRHLIYNGEFSGNENHYDTSPYGTFNVESGSFSPLRETYINAGKEFGYPETDFNGPQRAGFGPMEYSTKHGKRVNSYEAFLQDIENRQNLKILRYAHVYKIHLDRNRRATGVSFLRHGQIKHAVATKEIIVSAGAVNSAQLLMLSRIGPASHLRSVGITPKIDLPVGLNLQDHPTLATFPFSINETLSFLPERDFGFQAFIDYFYSGKGFLTNPNVVGAQAFISTSKVKSTGLDWPDIQLYIFSVGNYFQVSADFSKTHGYWKHFLDRILNNLNQGDGFVMAIVLVRPKSIGQIKLANKYPDSAPLINPNYLEHPDDLQALVEAAKFTIDLVENSKAFQKIGGKFHDTPIPGCEAHQKRSTAYWECFVRHILVTLYHPVGTCRMGKDGTDPKAVVDSKLRVIGVKGLRVADASIQPVIINANTAASCMMIGEKAANEFIRQYWSEQYLVCDRESIFQNANKLNQCIYSKLV